MNRRAYFGFCLNPMRGRGRSGGRMRPSITSNRVRMFFPCSKLSFSNRLNRPAKFPCAEITCRKWTNARTTCRLPATATREFSTLASMTTPCSVKACGRYFTLCPFFKVADCDLEAARSRASAKVSRNMKSSGNLRRFRLTCSLRRLVDTPYISARSLSSMTRRPRIKKIRLSIPSTGTKGASAMPIYTIDPSNWFPKRRGTSQKSLRSAAKERRERDSNPRGGFPPTRFQVARIRPLCHPSGTDSVAR